MAYSSLHNVPLEWIRAFETAGRTGSFTAAAEEAGLTQAAVSQRIANLEKHIGAALFVRKARGVTLSVDGEAWLPYVTAALEDLEQSYQGLFGAERHKISISASASVIQLWMVPRLAAWPEESRPQISFSTMVLPSDKLHQEATIKVRYGIGDWPDHHKVQLFTENLVPVVGRHYLQSGCDWQELPKIAVSGPRPGWREWASQTGGSATPVPRIWFDSFVSALNATLAGAGVLLGSKPLCRAQLENQSLISPTQLHLRPSQSYWMIARKGTITKRQWDAVVEVFTSTDTKSLK